MKVYSVTNTKTFELKKKDINSFFKMGINRNQWLLSDFLPSSTVKLENAGPTFTSLRPYFCYPSAANSLYYNFHDRYIAF